MTLGDSRCFISWFVYLFVPFLVEEKFPSFLPLWQDFTIDFNLKKKNIASTVKWIIGVDKGMQKNASHIYTLIFLAYYLLMTGKY